MKRLLILRHAKSSWAEAGLKDRERPLNKRGRRAAPLMGARMARKDYRPEGILCSPAVRTRETLELVQPHLGADIPVRMEPRIYLASGRQLLALLHELPEAWSSALLIGHNPGLEELVRLLREPGKSPCEAPAKFPTAALAVVDFPVTGWARVDVRMGRLVDLVKPRDIGG
ncbi:MAG: SixA phosphatase family protein [Alphaproteobacteria bacterium]